MADARRILITGGGIAGLSLAISLCSCGFATSDLAWFEGHLFQHPGHHQRPQR